MKTRRRSHDPEGRLLYPADAIPRELATRTELKVGYRKVPAEGQEPAGAYWSCYEYVPLFSIADAADMPALPPGRAAAWTRARTCFRCAKTNIYPFRVGVDGTRLCSGCQDPAAKLWWFAQRAADRREASAWAAGILAAGDAVLLAAEGGGWPGMPVRAETVIGRVVLDASMSRLRATSNADHIAEVTHTETAAGLTRIDRLAPQLAVLSSRRLVTWSRDGLRWLADEAAHAMPGPAHRLAPAGGDDFGTRWSRWMGERAHPEAQQPWRNNPWIKTYGPPRHGDPVATIAAMRAFLDLMASCPNRTDAV